MRQFIAFLFVGSFAALLNIATRIAVNQLISYESSIAVAFIVGLISAYLLNRIIVFGSSGRTIGSEFSYFVIVNLAALAQIYLISISLAWYVLPAVGVHRHAETIAHVVGVVTPVFSSYLLHKYLTFRKRVVVETSNGG